MYLENEVLEFERPVAVSHAEVDPAGECLL
jgi:hypothetical protein